MKRAGFASYLVASIKRWKSSVHQELDLGSNFKPLGGVAHAYAPCSAPILNRRKAGRSVNEIIAGANPGAIVNTAHRNWYRELFGPWVVAGLIPATALAGRFEVRPLAAIMARTRPLLILRKELPGERGSY